MRETTVPLVLVEACRGSRWGWMMRDRLERMVNILAGTVFCNYSFSNLFLNFFHSSVRAIIVSTTLLIWGYVGAFLNQFCILNP